MNKYNEDYYIVFDNYNENTLYLSALPKTFNRNYEYTKMQFGQEPLFFNNAYKEKDQIAGKKRPIKNAHLNLNFILVDEKIKESINNSENKNFQLYPAVILSDDNQHHDNFWFFNIFNELDCLDISKCLIDDYDEDDDEHDIEKYYLDYEKMAKIPEDERLIFIPKKTNIGHTFLHQKIVDVFNKHKVDTLKFIKVSEWEMGKQF
jgi:hypothetical protein